MYFETAHGVKGAALNLALIPLGEKCRVGELTGKALYAAKNQGVTEVDFNGAHQKVSELEASREQIIKDIQHEFARLREFLANKDSGSSRKKREEEEDT